MPLDESEGKRRVGVDELEAVLLEPQPSRIQRPQPLSLGDESGDPVLQLIDCSLLAGGDLGGAHYS